MKKRKIFIGFSAVILGIYIVAAPYITVYQMKSAAESQDGDALSEYIEFPSVRESLKDQMNAMMAKKMAEDDDIKKNPFSALGAAFAGMIIDKMVDVYVTPAGIRQLMAGNRPQPGKEQDENSSPSTRRKPLSDATMSYESIDKFVIRVKTDDGGEGKFVLRRRGLSWKLTDIVIPM